VGGGGYGRVWVVVVVHMCVGVWKGDGGRCKNCAEVLEEERKVVVVVMGAVEDFW
jgi:hypothetical protein